MSDADPLPESLRSWQQDFLRHLSDVRQYSRHTVANYGRHVESVGVFLFEHKVSQWSKVTRPMIKKYLAECRKRQMKPRSVALMLSSLRSFYKYLMANDGARVSPLEGLKAPKLDKALPKNLDVDQMNQLLEIDEDDDLALRDRAMMELMYSCGLRLDELVGCDLNDVDFINQEIKVLGKGNKERILPVGAKAVTWLKKWMEVRDNYLGDDPGALFLSKFKRRISHKQVQTRMKQWGLKQDIETAVHPHKLRHSFASHILESSQDLRAVQELLGHANLGTTQVYTHLDFQHLAKVYDAAHPRAKLKRE